MTATAVHVQCVHKLQVRTATSRKQHIYARAEQNVGGGKFSEITESGFCHAHHSSYKCPQRLFDPLRVLLMLIPFGTPCTSATSANKRIFTKTPSLTTTSMFACDMCKTRAQNTHDASTPTLGRNGVSDFICDLVRLDLMNRVREPSVPESGGGGLARTSSDGRRSAMSHLERLESNSRSGRGTRGSLNSSCDSSRISSSACNRKTIFASHRDAHRDVAGSARDCQGH